MKILKQTIYSALILLVWWLVVYAATNPIDLFNPWDTLSSIRINELVNKINDLETQMVTKADSVDVYTKTEIDSKITNLQNQINSLNASWDWTVSQIDSRVVSSTGRTNWTIPVEKDKPLIIWLKWTNEVSRIHYRVTAGSDTWTSPSSTYTFQLTTGTWVRTSSSMTLIPTTTSVTLQVQAYKASRAWELIAYQ